MTTVTEIDASTLKTWFADGEEIALLDTREEGLYGEGHALFVSNIPYSRLENEIRPLVPRFDTRIVLAGEPATDRLAFDRLFALGYRKLFLLAGGIAAWGQAGNNLFKSVFTISKAFAEVVEHAYHTPAIKAEELNRRLEKKEDIVILDCRTPEEFERFHVPGAVSCPSAELVYRIADLVPSPETFVVVSCAGRTRGIIGAQTLINAQIPNKVVALEGGTQGWKLAGLTVEKGLTARYRSVSDASRQVAEERAVALAKRFDVPLLDLESLSRFRNDNGRTVYLFDVRTSEEFADGHLPDAVCIPGGQILQTLDKWAAVRGARVILVDPAGVRAITTAHWLRQMGWDAYALRYDESRVTLETSRRPQPEANPVAVIDAAEARRWLSQGAAAISVDSSADFRKAHPQGALWTIRPRLDKLPEATRQAPVLLVFGKDVATSQLVAADLTRSRPEQKLFVVKGGPVDWAKADIEVVASSDAPKDVERIDFLFWLHDRHMGNANSSAQYLAWEGDLPRQIGSPEQAGFHLTPLA